MTDRTAPARRSADYRRRRREGARVVTVEIDAATVHALRRLGLLDATTNDAAALADAAATFLRAAGGLAAVGEALFP